MAEIFGGDGLHNAFNDLGIDARMTYKSAHEPYYEVWDLNKHGLKILEETPEWDETWGWFRHSKGSNNGTAADFFTVNGQFMIGWETRDGKDTYDSLTDYLNEGLGVYNETLICAYAVDLARTNGVSMGRLFEMYNG